MGWGKGGNKGKKGQQSRKREAKADSEELQYLKAVDARWHLNKACLRAYASATGSPFFASSGQTDAEFLGLGNTLEKQEPYTSEVVNRLGIALSEAGGTVEMGVGLLKQYGQDPGTAAEKLGINGMVNLLQTEAGQGLLEAAETFNKHSEAPKEKKDLEAAAKKWLKFFLEEPKEKAKSVQRFVKAAAKSYLLGMELLQWLAVGKDPSKWAQKMRGTKNLQAPGVQKWLRAPSDRERLLTALVAPYTSQTDIQQKKKQTLSDSEPSQSSAKSVGGGGASSSGSAADSSSSSSDAKKHKKKKDKKNAKKKAAKKKDKKKEKKDKDEGKKRKKSPSKSSEDAKKGKKKKQKSSADSGGNEKKEDNKEEEENSWETEPLQSGNAACPARVAESVMDRVAVPRRSRRLWPTP